MTQLRQKVFRKRTLSQKEINAYNEAVNAFNDLAKKLNKYESDKYIADIYNDLSKRIKDMELAKDNYLNTPVEEIITYNVEDGEVENVIKLVENFMKLIA